MNLKELFKSLHYGEWLLFSYGDENDIPEKIDRNGEDIWYYSFIVNDDSHFYNDTSFEEVVMQRLFELDELPKFIYIYEVDDDYLTLKKSTPFTPTEEEIDEIYTD